MTLNKYWLRMIVSAVVVGLFALALSGRSDQLAEDYVSQAFKRALVTFALVRGINAAVSVVQGTEVAIEPAGVGVTLAPGQALDPLNDLVERFSWVMLLATTSLGTQKVLVAASTSWILQAALGMAALLGVLLLWRSRTPGTAGLRAFTLRVVALIFFIRFAMPVVALVNHATYEAFLAERFDASYAALERTRVEVEQARAQPPGPGVESTGVFDSFGKWLDRTSRQFDVEQRLEVYQSKLGKATEQVVDLIVVFVLTTIVFPLIFLFFGLKLLRIIGQSRWSDVE